MPMPIIIINPLRDTSNDLLFIETKNATVENTNALPPNAIFLIILLVGRKPPMLNILETTSAADII
jgi:hypothetical protein